jgi:exopolysaccharide biosynthesis protein
MPCVFAEGAAYAPIDTWLVNNQPAPAPYKADPSKYLPDEGGYVDDSLSIIVDKHYWNDDIVQQDGPGNGITTVLAIRVKLSDPTQFRTALAGKYPSQQTMYVENMAKRNNAVLAINGDFFNYHPSGIEYRNGRKLRFNANNLRDLLIIDEQGDFHYLQPTSQKAWDAYIAEGGTVLHTFWFGPNLVLPNGQPMTKFTNNENNGPWMKTQRMIIGQVGKLEYLILCCEGPESADYSGQGLTLEQAAKLAVAYGLDNAYNLDGGSSTTVVLNNEKINSPSNPKRREVGDCIYFCTLVPNN